MPSTTNYGLRYPAASDEVASGSTNFANLADDVVAALGSFGGSRGSLTSGTTSGTTNRTLAEHTFTNPPAGMIYVGLCLIRYTQSVATDEFVLEFFDVTANAVVSELQISAASGHSVLWCAASLTRATTKTVRLRVRRTAGTGTLTVTTNSDANRYAFLALPGAF